MSIRKRMLLILIAAAIPGMAVAFFLASSALKEERLRSAETAEWLAKLHASSHSNVIENAKTIIDTVRQTAISVGLSGERASVDCSAFRKNWPALTGSLTALTYFAPDGEAVCASSETGLLPNAAGTDWFERAIEEREMAFSDYTVGEDGTPLIIAARAVANSDGDVQGVLALGIDLNWLGVLTTGIDLPEGANVIAMDSEGALLTQREGIAPEQPETFFEQIQSLLVDNLNGSLVERNIAGEDRVYGFATTNIGNLTVIVELPPFVPFRRATDALFNSLAAPMAILLLALLATAWASETFVVKWVRSLTDTADQIAEGDLHVRTDVPYSQGEIGQLAETFDEMADAIEQKQARAESLVTQREGLLDELSHRTANNMAILSSLVETERRRQRNTNPAADGALAELGGRIRTLANVHRLLYAQVEHATALERREAIKQLIDLLAEFYLPPGAEIAIRSDIEPIDLGMDRSVTFALLLNELLCNAYKHAFKDSERGTLSVGCHTTARNDGAWIELTVRDDGHGLPDDFDPDDSLLIATTLVKQLGGSIKLENADPGTRVEATFPIKRGD